MIDIRFKKYKSFHDVEGGEHEGHINATGSIGFVSFDGYRPYWTQVDASRTGVTSLDGLKEGLEEICLKEMPFLKSAVGLPASCQTASFDGTPFESLCATGEKMTEGLQTLSLRACKNLKSLNGMPDSCQKLFLNETNLKGFEGMSQNVEYVSAKCCPSLETTKGLSSKCKKLNLDWSGIRRLEDIPETIQEIRVYGCSLDTSCFSKIPVLALPKIVGLTFEQQKVVDTIYSRSRGIPHRSSVDEIATMSGLVLVRA